METQLSVWSSYYVEMSPEDAVRELKKHGICASELSDEHGAELLKRGDPKTVGEEFRKFLETENFTMTQGHLWLSIKICSDEQAVPILLNWLDLYEAIGIRNAVLHVDPIAKETELTVEERLDRNVEKLKLIEAHIAPMKIRVCLENLRSLAGNVDELLYMLAHLDSSHFGICLDTGHLNLTDPDQEQFILKAGDHLTALHIADNEGKTDQHMMPFGRGNVDFEKVVKALKQIDYHGLFNLEIPGERLAPLEVKGYKLEYIRKCFEYLMSI